MSGSGGGGGYNFQAYATAYIGACVLAQRPLNWLEDSPLDIPLVVAAETKGPGDDIRVTLQAGIIIEIQAKRGLKKNQKFWEAIVKLAHGLTKDPELRCILLVDSKASGPIKDELCQDLKRLGKERRDDLKGITKEVIERLRQEGIPDVPELFRRLSIKVVDFYDGSDRVEFARLFLSQVTADKNQARNAWAILVKDAHDLIEIRGRHDAESLTRLLSSHSIQVDTVGKNLANEQDKTFEFVELTKQGQIAERFAKAIEQLASDNPTIRLGGIYELERIAKDSQRDLWSSMEFLTTFVREASSQQKTPTPAGEIQAALTVIKRLTHIYEQIEEQKLDLRGVYLCGADLQGALFQRIDFREANLQEVNLQKADLRGGYFHRADLQGKKLQVSKGYGLQLSVLREANLQGADFSCAKLCRARFQKANLGMVNFRSANLSKADLQETNLQEANLYGADLQGANLQGADLSKANLRNTDLRNSNLQKASLLDALYDGKTQFPKNFNPINAGVRLIAPNVSLFGQNLKDTNLEGADLEGSI